MLLHVYSITIWTSDVCWCSPGSGETIHATYILFYSECFYKIYNKPNYWERFNMPKYIDILIIYILTTTENVTVIFAILACVS